MNNRDLVPMILLYLFTFGIYAIYWHFKFQEELKEKTGEGFGGLGHLLMLLFTVPLKILGVMVCKIELNP